MVIGLSGVKFDLKSFETPFYDFVLKFRLLRISFRCFGDYVEAYDWFITNAVLIDDFFFNCLFKDCPIT